MPVLSGRSHQGRIEAGNKLLAAAAARDTRWVKARLSTFATTHRVLSKAQAVVDALEEILGARRVAAAERDVDQDEFVDRVAAALVGDGLPRANPFAPVSPHTPTKLKALGYLSESAALTSLVARARKRKGLSPKTLAALAAAEKAAKAVKATVGALQHASGRVDAARLQRDALVQAWETSFAALKRGARAAEDEGAAGLFAALFESTAPSKKAKKAKAPAVPAPAPTP